VISSSRIALALSALVLALTSSAGAVTGSVPDRETHPYVGALVVDGSVRCSGVLVDRSTFVTAAHCVSGLPAGAAIAATFDAAIDKTSWTLHVGVPHVHPGYKSNGNDIAAVVLAEPVDVAPAALPRAAGADGLAGADVTSVGYGYHGVAADGSWLYDGLRRAADSPVVKVSKSSLRLDASVAGPCLGDSGGPQLVGDTVVSITTSGSKTCDKKVDSLRLDTFSVRTFLAGFVTLP